MISTPLPFHLQDDVSECGRGFRFTSWQLSVLRREFANDPNPIYSRNASTYKRIADQLQVSTSSVRNWFGRHRHLHSFGRPTATSKRRVLTKKRRAVHYLQDCTIDGPLRSCGVEYPRTSTPFATDSPTIAGIPNLDQNQLNVNHQPLCQKVPADNCGQYHDQMINHQRNLVPADYPGQYLDHMINNQQNFRVVDHCAQYHDQLISYPQNFIYFQYPHSWNACYNSQTVPFPC